MIVDWKQHKGAFSFSHFSTSILWEILHQLQGQLLVDLKHLIEYCGRADQRGKSTFLGRFQAQESNHVGRISVECLSLSSLVHTNIRISAGHSKVLYVS